MSNVKSNLWKFYIISILHRRNYFPLVSIFFLTMPNALAQQIGFYSLAGQIAAFLLEVPSGYISDKLGHKKTIVIALIFLFLSSLTYVFATSLIYFILGAIFTFTGFAFLSGSRDAFLHETLAEEKREKELGKVMAKMSGTASLVAIGIILALPSLTKIDFRLPFIIYAITDIISIIFGLSLKTPRTYFESKKPTNFLHVLKDFKKTGLIWVSLFEGFVFALFFIEGAYRYPFVSQLGLDVVYIGVIMAGSRFFWWVFSHLLAKIDSYLTLKRLLFADLLIFPSMYFAIYIFPIYWVACSLIAIGSGYLFGRMFFIRNHIVNDYIKDKRFKATTLSIHAQMQNFIQIIILIPTSIIAAVSLNNVYLFLGSLFIMVQIPLFIKIFRNN